MRRTLVCLFLISGSAGQAAPVTYELQIAPLLANHCIDCHGAKRQKGGLRLDSHPAILHGGEDGPVIASGDVEDSELIRRLQLPSDDDDHMPPEDKSQLSPPEIGLLQSWISAGASSEAAFDSERFVPPVAARPAAPDYRSRLDAAVTLANSLGVRLVPRSRVPTDGLVLRTASAPRNCDDAVLEKLAPFADLVVDAELARTPITDRGLAAVERWINLEHLDLTHTLVSTQGLAHLAALPRLETLNLTATRVDPSAVTLVQKFPALKKVWGYEPQ